MGIQCVAVAKLNYENSSSGAVFGHLEQLDDTGKAGIARKFGRDISKGDLENLSDNDFARRECIATTDLHVRSLPQANRSSDLAATNAIAESSKELHSLGAAPRPQSIRLRLPHSMCRENEGKHSNHAECDQRPHE